MEVVRGVDVRCVEFGDVDKIGCGLNRRGRLGDVNVRCALAAFRLRSWIVGSPLNQSLSLPLALPWNWLKCAGSDLRLCVYLGSHWQDASGWMRGRLRAG